MRTYKDVKIKLGNKTYKGRKITTKPIKIKFKRHPHRKNQDSINYIEEKVTPKDETTLLFILYTTCEELLKRKGLI